MNTDPADIEPALDLGARPPWSGKKLAKLGDAIARGEPAPAGCPRYTEVVAWHSRLCAEVAAVVLREHWHSVRGEDFDVTTRAKTHDTLKQKLIRESSLHLQQVQDLAGIRIDIDCGLDQQTALADEIAEFFRNDGEVIVKDIRATPHSGYRAIHLWLRLPAGRAEIQIRTRGQSAWANAYEQLGDTVGRGIRYGDAHPDPLVQLVVDTLHMNSSALARLEISQQEVLDLEHEHSAAPPARPGQPDSVAVRITTLKSQHAGLLDSFVTGMEQVRVTLDRMDPADPRKE